MPSLCALAVPPSGAGAVRSQRQEQANGLFPGSSMRLTGPWVTRMSPSNHGATGPSRMLSPGHQAAHAEQPGRTKVDQVKQESRLFFCHMANDNGRPSISNSICVRNGRGLNRRHLATVSPFKPLLGCFHLKHTAWGVGDCVPGSWWNDLAILAAVSGTFQIWFPTHQAAGDTCLLSGGNGEGSRGLLLFFLHLKF